MGRSDAGGSPANSCFGTLGINDDTGVTITVTTGGTYYPVKHATTMVAGPASKDAALTVSATNGTISIPASKLGYYRVTASGVLLGANSATVKVAIGLDGAIIADANGNIATRSVMAASAVERPWAMGGIVTCSAACTLGVIVTSGSNSDTVNFKRFYLSVELIGTL